MATSVYNNDYYNFVVKTLNAYKNDAIYGWGCRQALSDQKWLRVNTINEVSSYLTITLPKVTYVYIIREYDMRKELLRAPKGANVLYIINKFYGIIPPRPKTSTVKYEIHTPILVVKQSNALIYRWFMPASSGLRQKLSVGPLYLIKLDLKKGYDLKYGETYDLNEYVYDENVIPGTFVCTPQTEDEAEKIAEEEMKRIADKKSSPFYRDVLEFLIAHDNSDKCTPEMSGAIKKAMDNIKDCMELKDTDDAIYYYNDDACVCIKKIYTPSDCFKYTKGDTLVIIDKAICPKDDYETVDSAQQYVGNLILGKTGNLLKTSILINTIDVSST